MKNFACYVVLASGTPMILDGDEFARTQRGNNNAYCQDNEISWFDWTLVERNQVQRVNAQFNSDLCALRP